MKHNNEMDGQETPNTTETPETQAAAAEENQSELPTWTKAEGVEKVPFYKQSRFKYGSMATAITAIFIAVLVVINIVFTVVVNKYPLSVDMTAKQTYKFTSDTINYLKTFKSDVTIYALDTEGNYKSGDYMYVYESLRQYPEYNSHITLKFVNLDQNPQLKTKYSSETFAAKDVLVVCGDRYKHLAESDLLTYNTDYQTYSQTLSSNNTEEAVTGALLFVTASDLPQVIISTGNGETSDSYAGVQTLLTKNNYSVTTRSLATTEAIDANTKMIVIANPQTDFSTDEIKRLSDFLDNGNKYGKSLMVMLDPRVPDLPNLTTFLKDVWGIEAGTGYVYDQTNAIQQVIFPLATSLDTDVFKNFSNSPVMLPYLRPLTLAFDSKNGVTTKSLMSTYDTSRLWVPADSTSSFTPSDSDKKGPFVAAALSTKSVSGGSELLISNVLVTGSTLFADSSLIQETSINNGNAAVTMANTLAGYKPAISIVPKDLTSTQLSIQTSSIYVMLLIFLILIPLAVIILGIVVFVRRRHK